MQAEKALTRAMAGSLLYTLRITLGGSRRHVVVTNLYACMHACRSGYVHTARWAGRVGMPSSRLCSTTAAH